MNVVFDSNPSYKFSKNVPNGNVVPKKIVQINIAVRHGDIFEQAGKNEWILDAKRLKSQA